MIIPANHSYDDPEGKIGNGAYNYDSHVLISDNHGKTWRMSHSIRPGCNESQVIELNDGKLLMNMRSSNDKYCMAISFSNDGGETWSEIQSDIQLVESKCQASILTYGNYKGKEMYLFSNPTVVSGRTHLTIRTSFDECKSWSYSRLIFRGPSAYSCFANLKNGHIGILFEFGAESDYECLRFISFPCQ